MWEIFAYIYQPNLVKLTKIGEGEGEISLEGRRVELSGEGLNEVVTMMVVGGWLG
jgi:hypothetical protein